MNNSLIIFHTNYEFGIYQWLKLLEILLREYIKGINA